MARKLVITKTNSPSGDILDFYTDGTAVAQATSGSVTVLNGSFTFSSSYSWSAVTSAWGGYPTSCHVVENADESETVTLVLSNGDVYVGDATGGGDAFYTFDNLVAQDRYGFSWYLESSSFSSTKNGTTVENRFSMPLIGTPTTSGQTYTWSGNFGTGTTAFESDLGSNMVAWTINYSTNAATMTLADGTVLEGTGAYSAGDTLTFSNMIVTSQGSAPADTYGFIFRDDYEDNVSFSSTKNGTTVDNYYRPSSVPNPSSNSFSGNFGTGTAIFGSSYLNSNLVGYTISGSSATMTLANGTVLEGTTSASYGQRTFSDMVITSSGSSATQLDTPTASASCTASGVLTITGLNDSNADGYKVKYWNTTQTESNATTATLTVSSGSATLNLTTGYSYTIKVQAVGDGTTYSDSEWSSAVGPTPVGVQLSYPSSLAFSSVTSSGFYASWATVTGATGYKLQYKITSDNQWTEVSTSTNNFYTLTGLVYGTTYDVQVKALGSGTSYTDSDWSPTSRQTTTAAATQLDRPSAPTVVQTAPMTIQIGGLTDSNAIGYKVRYNKSGTGMDVYITSDTLTPVDGVVTLAVRTDSPYGAGEYNFGVQAIGDGSNYTDSQWSPLSEGINLAPASQLPVPTGFTATYNTVTNTHTISGLNVANAVGYKLYISHMNSSSVETGTLTAVDGTITYTDSYGFADDEDSVAIKAVGDGVNYLDSNWSDGFEPSYVHKLYPPVFSATGGEDEIVLSGLNTSNATAYNIKYKLDSASSWTTLSDVVPTSGSYTITGLSTPNTYDIQVQATSSNPNYLDSDWSTTRQASTVVIPALDAPTLTSTATTTTSITLGGLSVSNANSYLIRYKISTASEWTEITPTVVQGAYTLSNLAVETTYQIQGKSISSNHANYQDSDWSTPALEVTTDYIPVTLTAPTITTTTNDRHSIVVSGLNDANATGYVLSYSVHGEENWITTNTVQAVSGSYTLSGLTVETVYDVKAKAIGDGGKYLDSPFSSVVTGETAAMAGSTGGIFRPIETTSTMLSDIEVESGQFIICTDTRKLYYDTSTNTRIELQ